MRKWKEVEMPWGKSVVFEADTVEEKNRHEKGIRMANG